MTRSVPATYEMNESQYNLFRGFFRTIYVASSTVTLSGLAGIVASSALSHFGNSENQQLAKQIMDFSLPLTVAVLPTLWAGVNYYMNPSLNKTKKQE